MYVVSSYLGLGKLFSMIHLLFCSLFPNFSQLFFQTIPLFFHYSQTHTSKTMYIYSQNSACISLLRILTMILTIEHSPLRKTPLQALQSSLCLNKADNFYLLFKKQCPLFSHYSQQKCGAYYSQIILVIICQGLFVSLSSIGMLL